MFDVKNFVKEFKNKKVFLNRRVEKVLKDVDILVFIIMVEYRLCIIGSREIKKIKIEIGVVCYDEC